MASEVKSDLKIEINCLNYLSSHVSLVSKCVYELNQTEEETNYRGDHKATFAQLRPETMYTFIIHFLFFRMNYVVSVSW